ncbi:MAG: thiamine pyrophosphate-binding protein [Chromatiaceae bacterium]|nr:thiamine pyrophosphate-binding protein [Gammaproteobacteria bacterium]MCP5305330.1 thiamine pyrophosphate-binding protein [Chromatiaceae bacterium]MCP5315289.1 thiamine pyrophosphate-binding protein [Chromatiaceae bacterium]
MQIPVSELIVRFMQRLGIEVVFGMPGAHVLPIYDGLYASPIRTVLVKHEQGASFMAGGFARVSHQVAACIATAGPGATNLVTGIANAYAEQLPVLVVTGETSTYIFGRGGLQESSGEGGAIDQAELFRGITRYRKLIERTDYLVQVLNQATQALFAAQPGPVLLSIPFNVQKETVDEDVLDQVHFPVAIDHRGALAGPVAALTDLIEQARNPVIIAGYGCIKAGARAAVSRLSEGLGIPVATSLKGKGVVAEDSDLALGCLGVTSNGTARQYIVEHADLVIFLGAGFNERTSYLWSDELLDGKRVAQVDRDAAQLGRVFKPDLAIQGDIHQVLTELLARLRDEGARPKSLAELADHREGLTTDPDDSVPGRVADESRFALIAGFYRALARRFPHDAMVFDDNIVFAQNYFDVSDSNHYFPNSGISSLGHAIPAAIGARFHATDSPVFAILGDGGFQMCCMEIMTAVNYGIPLNIVVINNATMGLIRKNQFQLYGERYIDCDFVNPDFAWLARSFGIQHYRVADEAAIEALFATADLRAAINLIEIPLDKQAFPHYLSSR